MELQWKKSFTVMSLLVAALSWIIILAPSVLRAKAALTFGRQTEKKGLWGKMNLYKSMGKKNNQLFSTALHLLLKHESATILAPQAVLDSLARMNNIKEM